MLSQQPPIAETPDTAALAADATMLWSVAAAMRAAAGGERVLHPVLAWVIAGRSRDYRWKGVLDLMGLLVFLDAEDATEPIPWRVVGWLAEQRSSMTADSLSQVLSRMRTTADVFAPVLAASLRAPLVAAALEGMRRGEGPTQLIRGAVPLPVEGYTRVRDSATGQAQAMCVLMWHAAMRFADVAAVRQGGLWWEQDVLVVELPVSKTHAIGLPRGIRFVPPPRERGILLPWTASAPPVSRPFARVPLFDLGYVEFATVVKRVAGGEFTPHSFRKGAVQHLLRRGGRIQDIPLLTLHRSLPGLLAYANAPDAETQDTVRALSAMLAR